MASSRKTPETPACYAMVHEGLESIAAEEIAQSLGGEIKRLGSGLVVFRVPEIDRSILTLRTVEDVFLYAWGTDKLSYRATDLESIQRWTDRDGDWDHLLKIHHAVTPKPKGKTTLRYVAQMNGVHGYRRIDASKAMARGLAGKLPSSWRFVDENASIEIWLKIDGAMAICGLRLSDRTMRHRTYKHEHLQASIRPTVAGVIARLADLKPGQTVLDPMCGAGTLLAEAHLSVHGKKGVGGTEWEMNYLGGDIDAGHVRASLTNLRQFGIAGIENWDARQLPLDDESVDRVICNPPFGKQMSTPEEIDPLYRQSVREMDRVLKPGGKSVLIVSDAAALRAATEHVGWKELRRLGVRLLGQRAFIGLYRKAAE
ncbi:MAG: methyltransferase domain-containing protein [Gemmataceae bacterium]|nr:methyltransferase domain-containing protein [Gemmataceae bacterium]